MTKKIRVVIIGGTLETSLRPIPPIADGAPEWNVFRLTEAAAANPESQLEIHVISPCEDRQLTDLLEYQVQAKGRYHHVVFRQRQLTFYRQIVKQIPLLRLWSRRFEKLPDLMSSWYLRRAIPTCLHLDPDVIIINDRPQYVRFLRRSFPKVKLLLMLRYQLGESGRFLNLLDGVIVNSHGMRTYTERFLGSSPTPVWQIPNTLDDDFFSSALALERFESAGKVILFAGRLVEEKGAREVLLAFQKIVVVLPNVRLVICGLGETLPGEALSSYEHELRHLAGQLAAGAVEFAGYIPNRQMQEYYRQAHVAVFPSLPDIYVESFGMVALEAMRCGTPLVVSRQPGFEELIVPGETGWMVDDPRDAEALAQAILQILQKPDLARRMAQAGYQRSLGYTPQKGLQALQAIIVDSLLHGKNPFKYPNGHPSAIP